MYVFPSVFTGTAAYVKGRPCGGDTGEVIDGSVTLGPAPAQCAPNSP